jgi:hypothetical protein
MERNTASEKKPYEAPKLTVHGDVEAITLGEDVGDDLDAAFTTSSSRGRKKPRKDHFS